MQERIKAQGIEVVVYEPTLETNDFFNSRVIKDLDEFKKISDVIIVNRLDSNLDDVKDKMDQVIEQYENGEGFVAENKNNYIKLALRELRQFNSAVRQQKSENHNMLDSSEVDNNGKY